MGSTDDLATMRGLQDAGRGQGQQCILWAHPIMLN